MDNASSILRVRDLNKSFAGIVAAKNINTDVKQGEVVGIIGANGAGKTVFVNMITGYLTPSSGSIEFVGRNITGIQPRDATHIGVCRSFQISQVFMSMTVMNNLLVAISLAHRDQGSLLSSLNSAHRVRECEQVMEGYKLSDYRDQIAGTLAQGVRKLLDIAMAVVSKPKLLLLDEPTAGVSVDEKFNLMDIVVNALKEQGTAVLFVEHDMEVVQRYVDRIMAFYQGEVICDAPPELAMKNPKVIEYVLGSGHGIQQVADRPEEPRHA